MPAKHVAQFVSAVEQQYGPANSDLVTAGLSQAAGSGNEARKMHRLLVMAGLKADMPVRRLPGPFPLPVLYMTDWTTALQKRGMMRRLYGGLRDDEVERILSLYWQRMRKLIPNHEVFQMIDQGLLHSSTCIPMYIHTDEGRGLKKSGLMVVSSSPALGRGTAKQRRTRILEHKLGLNFLGATEGNRFVHVATPKSYYDEAPDKYQSMLSYIALNCRMLIDEGFQHSGKQWHLVYVSSIGDWPAHVKNGNLLRHFGRSIKKANTPPSAWRGICHFCSAGIEGVPWEHYSLNAKSLQTVGLVEAWKEDGALLNLIIHHGARHEAYQPDIWHGWSLGWGKEVAASAAVLLVPFFEGARIDDRVAAMDLAIKQYLRDRPGEHLSFNLLTRSKLGWTTAGDFPKGAWQKAEDTRIMMQFLIAYMQGRPWAENGDKLLDQLQSALEMIDQCFAELYGHGYFLDAADGKRLASMGLTFLQTMSSCIAMCVRANRCLFKQQPKTHMLFHAFATMWQDSVAHGYCLNPLATSCQMLEDHIGKTCRSSRRVDPRQTSYRTLQASLINAGMKWAEPYDYD